jgi:RNA polymerase sigma-70 factor (ECF subfamily)
MNDIEFEKLFREQFSTLCNLAASIVKDSDEAKDIVQQVFIKLWQKRGELNIRGPLAPYLCRAVINTAYNSSNKSNKTVYLDNHPELSNVPEADLDLAQRKENIETEVKKAIEALPPVCRNVFSMSRYTTLTNKEIASELNISVKAVEKHISKAYKTLRETLKPLVVSVFILSLFVYQLLQIYFF